MIGYMMIEKEKQRNENEFQMRKKTTYTFHEAIQ